MKKATKSVLIISLIIFIYSSCKKYPDGPLISFTSKEKRLERTWTLEYLEIGGVDSTCYFLDENDSGFKFNYMRLKFGRDASYVDYGSHKNLYRFVYINCSLIDNKKKLSIDRQNYDPPAYSPKDQVGPFWVNEKVEFRIRKLTKEELWLETTYNGNLTKAHFREK